MTCCAVQFDVPSSAVVSSAVRNGVESQIPKKHEHSVQVIKTEQGPAYLLAEGKALTLVVVGSSPSVGACNGSVASKQSCESVGQLLMQVGVQGCAPQAMSAMGHRATGGHTGLPTW